MNGYALTENWFSFVAENSDKVDCKHTAMYLYIVEMFNKRNWVDVVGIPTDFVMGVLNIKSYKTYVKTLDELIDFGFIEMVEKSKNQYTSNKIALVKNAKATTKASPKHMPKQVQSNDQGKLSIIKLLNIETIKLINDNFEIVNENLSSWINSHNKKPKAKFDFAKKMIEDGFDKKLVSEWMEVRKKKGGTNSETAYDDFISQVEKSKKDKNEILKLCVIKSWRGFNHTWESNINPSEPQKEKMFIYYELDSIDPKREHKAKESLYNEYIQQGRNIKFIRNEGV